MPCSCTPQAEQPASCEPTWAAPGTLASTASAVAALLLTNASLHALVAVGERDGRPWLVLSDNAQTRDAAEALLRAHGLPIVPARAPRPSCAHAAPAAAATEMGRGGFEATVAVLQDFFALSRAAGVVALAPRVIVVYAGARCLMRLRP